MKETIGDCTTCGRLVCMAGSGRLAKCKHYVSGDILQRALRDEHANERALRGMA